MQRQQEHDTASVVMGVGLLSVKMFWNSHKIAATVTHWRKGGLDDHNLLIICNTWSSVKQFSTVIKPNENRAE